MTDVSAFPGGLPTDYRVHLEWVRHSAEGATIDAFDLTWAPYGDRIRETLVPFYIADDGSGLLTLTDAGMAELTENWAAKADTSFANVTIAGTLAVQGDATFAANESFYIDGPAGTTRDIIGSTLGLFRWGVELGSSAAEAGSNAGSGFAIDRYNDSGVLIDQPFTINRATGMATFISPVKFPSNAIVAASNPSGLDGIQIDGPALSGLGISGQRAGSLRWRLVLGQGTAESGSNAGSDLAIARYTDAGTVIDNPFLITRSTGGVKFTIAGNAGANMPHLDAPAGTSRAIMASTAGLDRWSLLLGSSEAESGSSAGSNFWISRYNDAGAIIDQPVKIDRATGALTFRGSQAADNAIAGNIGEVISSIVATPGVTLTTATAASITSISLTAGDWDVSGEVAIAGGAAGPTLIAAAINPGVAMPALGLGVSRAQLSATFPASAVQAMALRPARVSLAATTTYNLVAQATFASGTTTAYGNITARRAR